jgi:hypothetical protein
MLKYVGNGAALPDVPARDLSKDEIQALNPEVGLQTLINRLKASGLYAQPADDKAKAPKGE